MTALKKPQEGPPLPAIRENAVVVEVPLKTPNMTNQREHHMARARRQKIHRDVTMLCLKAARVLWRLSAFPGDEALVDPRFIVTLTRMSPGTLDAHDNLHSALKSVVDGIADYLGVDDADPRVEWRYGQAKGKAAVRIAFEVAP